MSYNRLAFLDVVKIIGIILVVLHHVAASGLIPWDNAYNTSGLNIYFVINLQNLYLVSFGTVGVSLFLFASGCSLALNCKGLDNKEKLGNFYKKRILRIYPSYWLGILFATIVSTNVLQQTFTTMDYIKIISGFQSFGATTYADFYGKINPPLWFISLILSLYLLFPLLYHAIKRHPHISILAFFFISLASRYYFGNVLNTTFVRGIDWFPLCATFEFGLGVYLARIHFYPKLQSNALTTYFGNVSFYIYLINGPLLLLLRTPWIFITAILVVSAMFYTFDQAIKNAVSYASHRIHHTP
jgi:peptidoglycan/LPS O-acetylase OafA/YrhL